MFQHSKKFTLVNLMLIILIFVFSAYSWICKMAISSDIPVSIDFNEFMTFLSIALIYMILNFIAVKTNKSEKMFLLIHKLVIICSALIWSFTLINEIRFQYHYLSTISALIGFFTNLVVLIIQLFNSKRRNQIWYQYSLVVKQ